MKITGSPKQFAWLGGAFIIAATLLLANAFTGCQKAESDPVTVTTWFRYTAPGDDGIVGQAFATEIRTALDPNDLINDWDNCVIASGHPPWAPGTYDSVMATLIVETGVDYYFALKVADEVPNWSVLSNIIMRNWPDVTPPSPVGDLSIAD